MTPRPTPRHPFVWLQHTLRALTALCLAGATSLVGATEEKPLWEVGLGVATVSFPAYRGSDQNHSWVLPAPYFVYRGEFLKADRQGLRAQLFDTDRLDISFSGALSPPASSEEIRTRSGMPDLDANFEVGPQIDLRLWRSADHTRQLQLLFPLRAAFTLTSRPRSIGWVFHPKFNMDITHVPGLPGWNVGLQFGPLFGDKRQHNHYYGVDTAFATPERPAYQAPGGYAGMQYLAGVSKRYPSHWVGAFLRYDHLGGARFVNSPLVRTRDYLAAGVAVSWILGSSTTRVLVDE